MNAPDVRNSADWIEIPVSDVGEAVMAAIGMAGIECSFFTSGSELCFVQEAIAKSEVIGRPTPKLVTINHEHISLNAALGYAAVSGKPAVTVSHTDSGTLHHGAAIPSAYHSGLPVLMLAGGAPTAYPGSMPGARAVGGHIWAQQSYDQHAIVRQYVKWDHRLDFQDNPGLIVSRALQVACSPPCGPVYLSLPSEISYRRIESVRFPTLDQLGIARAPAPDPDGIREVARRLVEADNPFVVVSGSGRNPQTIQPLVDLCELLGLPVVHSISRVYHSFPTDHPLFQGVMSLADADFVLALDAAVPWMPGPTAPTSNAFVAVIDVDPIKLQFPTYEFTANLRLASDPLLAILSLRHEVEQLLTTENRSRFVDRTARWVQASTNKWHALQEQARSRATRSPIDQLWLGYQIGQELREDDIVIDDTLASSHFYEFVRMARPGSCFSNPGSSGGWAPGAALGAKFAAPDRDVIAVTGDGYYMFGTPTPALWAAAHYKRPFMIIVYQNRSYSTGVTRLKAAYPDSYGTGPGFDYEGGYFDPPIDFAKEAEAAGAYGENVRNPSEISAALKRGRAQLRNGIPAVIAVWLPKVLKTE